MRALPSICPFGEFIQSELFTFYIGEEKKAFVVHSGAVAATSEYFRALVKGNMSEAASKSAELADIEPDDFARFLEYAYRGGYTVPPWILDEGTHAASKGGESPVVEEQPPSQPPDSGLVETLAEEPEAALETVPDDESFGWGLTSEKKVKKKPTKSTLRSSFQQRSYLPKPMPHHTILDGYRPTTNTAANEDFTPVFLAHAHLYTFAEMRLVKPLQELALYKLHKTLLEFKLYHQRVGDVVELTRYAYENGPSRSESGFVNDLRQLVVEYMACEVDILGKHPEFQTLLEGGGEFVSDFWRIVTRYML